MPSPQFTLRSLLMAMLVVGAFFGGIQFERERRRQEDEAADKDNPKGIVPVPEVEWGVEYDKDGSPIWVKTTWLPDGSRRERKEKLGGELPAFPAPEETD